MRPRARRGTFSAPLIIEAALAQLDQHGLHALTMRRLADVLGTEPMSLYAHIANKDELLALVKAQLFSEVRTEPADAAWDAKLRTVMVSTHDIAVRHPCFIPLWLNAPKVSGSRLRYEEDLATLRAAGFPEDEAPFSLQLLVGHVVSYSMHGFDGAALRSPHHVEGSYGTQFPVGHHDVLFEFGLDTILDGLRARHAQLHRKPRRTALRHVRPDPTTSPD